MYLQQTESSAKNGNWFVPVPASRQLLFLQPGLRTFLIRFGRFSPLKHQSFLPSSNRAISVAFPPSQNPHQSFPLALAARMGPGLLTPVSAVADCSSADVRRGVRGRGADDVQRRGRLPVPPSRLRGLHPLQQLLRAHKGLRRRECPPFTIMSCAELVRAIYHPSFLTGLACRESSYSYVVSAEDGKDHHSAHFKHSVVRTGQGDA